MAKTAQNTETETVEEMKPYDPWKDMRRVFIPRRSRGEQPTLEVGVNDRTFFVPKDTFTEVPFPVWEVIEEMQHQERVLDAYLSSNEKMNMSAGKQ